MRGGVSVVRRWRDKVARGRSYIWNWVRIDTLKGIPGRGFEYQEKWERVVGVRGGGVKKCLM